jgi:hypothetical protein
MGWLSSLKKSVPFLDPFDIFSKDDGEDSSIARPKYYTDPIYTETQGALKDMGLGLMKGEVPDYYKSIGETGGKEFEDMLSLTTRDITKSAAEASAASGRSRGGSLPAITAGAVADAATKARYSDYNRALAGKQGLLTTGIATTQGVRGSAQSEQGNQNTFNWKDYQAQVDERAYQDAKKAQEDAALGEMIGTIASVGLGMATGGMSFGLQGAMAGGLDAFTGGGTNFLGGLNKNPAKSMAGVSSIGSISDDMFKDFDYSMSSGNNSLFDRYASGYMQTM